MNRNHFFGLLAGAAATAITVVPAFADDDKKAEKEEVKEERKDIRQDAKERIQALSQRVKARVGQGEIKSIDAGRQSFVIARREGDLTVTTNSSTTYHQGRDQDLKFASIKVGQHVVVQAELPSATGTPAAGATPTPITSILARRVIIQPERKERPQRLVTVGSVTNLTIASDGRGSFTLNPVTPAGSPAVSFVVDADTVYTLKGIIAFANGQRARVISINNDAGQNVARKVRVPAGD